MLKHMFSLNFSNLTRSESQLGGGAWLKDIVEWPVAEDTEKPLTPLLTVRQSLFVVPTLPGGMVVTVFIPCERSEGQFKASTVRKFTANDTKQFELLRLAGARVLLHEEGDIELFKDDCQALPRYSISASKFTEQEMAEENEDDYVGVLRSKLFGRPGWLQDELFLPPKLSFSLQLFESDLRKADHAYDGIFRDGAGYLFLSQNLKKLKPRSEAGVFVAQFT
jgi:hypothetical protein